MTKKHISIAVLAVVVALGAGFWGGMTYARSSLRNAFTGGRAPEAGGAQNGFARFGGPGGGRSGDGFASGEILNTDDTSVTVKLQDGSTKIVLFSPTTVIMRSATGTADDLATGTNIVVMGAANSDGSITAESIQLRPTGTSPQPAQTSN